jgi:hypothetical protein
MENQMLMKRNTPWGFNEHHAYVKTFMKKLIGKIWGKLWTLIHYNESYP